MGLFDIDEIQPGMSANIYVAFELADFDDVPFYMVFDDGYIIRNSIGEVYVEQEE